MAMQPETEGVPTVTKSAITRNAFRLTLLGAYASIRIGPES